MSVSFLQKTLSSLFQRGCPRAKLNAGAFFARVKAFLSTFIAFFDGGNCKVVANFFTTFTTFTTLRKNGALKGLGKNTLPQKKNLSWESAVLGGEK